ncbi:methylated-DNA--[protein]-cysteine S-methyltransferase [Achromobacter veterisilvae]|uniref:Methylated-DNA--protein-cysteine methyltransferase n=1 Tax=Achromobacter veterisilvae TaxID=2069367 RepID=A0ABZ2RY16_9BURK
MPALTFALERVATPLGQMLVLTDEQQRLRAVDWEDHETRMHTLLRRQYGTDAVRLDGAGQPSRARRALEAYFDGELAAIDGFPVAFGGTVFQRQVWQALRGIAGGQTVSYGALAHRIERPTAVRAVGLANGANPVGIVIPCHRVIGANASLTGYGGGLHRKRWLLEHEARHCARPARPSTPG